MAQRLWSTSRGNFILDSNGNFQSKKRKDGYNYIQHVNTHNGRMSGSYRARVKSKKSRGRNGG